VWTKNDMSPAMAHSGVIIGVDEEAVESRCSDKVDASSPNSNRARHDATGGAAPGRSLQEISRAVFPAVHRDNGRIGISHGNAEFCAWLRIY
jgi:hypothetical protein